MSRNRRIPSREWLAVVFPVTCAVILLVAAFTNSVDRPYGCIVVLSCFAAGAAVPLSYTLVLLRERRLYLRHPAEIERSRDRIAGSRGIGWILGGCLLAVGMVLGGISRAVFLATLGGLAFGVWPGLLANFLRLRRDRHWG